MKISICCGVALLIAVQSCSGGVLSDKLQEIGQTFKTTSTNINTDLKAVGKALVEHGKNRFMEVLKEGLAATLGAVVQSFEGFNLFGKRDLDHSVVAIIAEWVENHKADVERIFRANFERLGDVVDEIASGKFDVEDLLQKLRQINERHEMEVRGVLSDTLNTGIDWIKNIWKTLTQGAEPVLSEPLMLSKRSLSDVIAKFTETIQPHIESVVQITKDITSTIAHHAGKFFDQHKGTLVDKVKEVLSGIHETLKQHLTGQQNAITGDEDVVGF